MREFWPLGVWLTAVGSCASGNHGRAGRHRRRASLRRTRQPVGNRRCPAATELDDRVGATRRINRLTRSWWPPAPKPSRAIRVIFGTAARCFLAELWRRVRRQAVDIADTLLLEGSRLGSRRACLAWNARPLVDGPLESRRLEGRLDRLRRGLSAFAAAGQGRSGAEHPGLKWVHFPAAKAKPGVFEFSSASKSRFLPTERFAGRSWSCMPTISVRSRSTKRRWAAAHVGEDGADRRDPAVSTGPERCGPDGREYRLSARRRDWPGGRAIESGYDLKCVIDKTWRASRETAGRLG